MLADQGYKGIKQYKEPKIYVPVPDKNMTQAQRKKQRRRAATEPIIGHLEKDYRLCRNYLKGIVGNNINEILATAAMYVKGVINRRRSATFKCWLLIHKLFVNAYWNRFALKPKTTF